MAGKLVISNTTPLLNFSQVERMDLLQGLFGEVIVPPAVVDELAAKATLFPQAARLMSRVEILQMSPVDGFLAKSLASLVHKGEAECLALGMEHPGSLLLLDDLAARELATVNGIRFIGTLGCLLMAKRQGLLPEIYPLLQDLRTKARFWISGRLAEKVLREAGEA